MPRYFLEVSYKGTNYSGFQVQENAKTVQSEVQTALQTLYKKPFLLTGSSRTDAGVHGLQNFFHFDIEFPLHPRELYNLNAILPGDISAKAYYIVDNDAHCRFGAVAREYKYFIYRQKNPFLNDRAWYYPFKIDRDVLALTADLVKDHHNFIAFSKRNTQVKNFNCAIQLSDWVQESDCLVYHVSANRFLRGMVRALVSSMLKAARGTITVEQFLDFLNSCDQATADFSAPAHGLFLTNVSFAEGYMRSIND
jgi:tRNA pseudouridine38-40 synthase